MANLVLNGISIDSIDDIAENFLEADVLREFKSGSLAAWLEEYGYDDELERVREIKTTASSIRILASIIDALNLDDEMIAQANARRKEQQRKEDEARKASEEQQRRDEEEERQRKECENRQKNDECAHQQRASEEEQILVEEEKSPYSFNKLLRKAQNGDAFAQYRLGGYFYSGYGVAEDKGEAVKWYRKAAEHKKDGYATLLAQLELGNCYYNGEGVNEDKKEAVKWYRKAAEQGNRDALCRLGICYLDGQNREAAMHYLREAASRGNHEASEKLKSISR